MNLAWHPHGGSHLQITYGEVMDLDVADRPLLEEFIMENRGEEAKAYKEAARKSGR